MTQFSLLLPRSASPVQRKYIKEEPMLHIVFEYQDQYTNGRWNQQECIVSSVPECKRLYGLGKDCEYRFILIEEV